MIFIDKGRYLGWCVVVHTHTLSGQSPCRFFDYSAEFCPGVSVEGIYNDPKLKTVSEFKVIEKKESENDGLERRD